MIVTNDLGERYAFVSDYGEATFSKDGGYHVVHRALYEDRYIRVSWETLVSIFKVLDATLAAA